MFYKNQRLAIVVRLVAVGEEMNLLVDSSLSADEILERWTSLNSYRTTLWRLLGVEESTLVKSPIGNRKT